MSYDYQRKTAAFDVEIETLNLQPLDIVKLLSKHLVGGVVEPTSIRITRAKGNQATFTYGVTLSDGRVEER